jgi:hypothetical protein
VEATDWVETGRRKSQAEGLKAQEKPAKTNGQRDSRTKTKGSKGGTDDVDGTKDICDEPGALRVEYDAGNRVNFPQNLAQLSLNLTTAPLLGRVKMGRNKRWSFV